MHVKRTQGSFARRARGRGQHPLHLGKSSARQDSLLVRMSPASGMAMQQNSSVCFALYHLYHLLLRSCVALHHPISLHLTLAALRTEAAGVCSFGYMDKQTDRERERESEIDRYLEREIERERDEETKRRRGTETDKIGDGRR